MSSLSENVKQVFNNIQDACAVHGKNAGEITVIAATKTVQVDTLSNLKDLGISICGENRVQELLSKHGFVDTEWHFIGRLQTNKVKYICDKVTMIHSLDRTALAEEIEKQCAKRDIIMDALIEVNVAGEAQKGGIPYGEAEEFYRSLSAYPHIRVRGLMSVMPILSSGGVDEQYYLQTSRLYDTIKASAGEGFKYLSVGMSDDYITAVKYGANMLRLGRVLFGEREYT